MRNNGRKTAVLISTPEHGNLGDQAIVYAEKRFFEIYFPAWNVLEIPAQVFHTCSHRLHKKIDRRELIVIDGGGNIGSLWPEVEYKMQMILRLFSENPVVIFPETAFFDLTQEGQELLKKSVSIYQSHKKLLVALRDQSSYDLFQKSYAGVHSLLVPDIVLFLDETKKASLQREGVLLCFRDDKEASISEEMKNVIIHFLSEKGIGYSFFSTHIHREVIAETRISFLTDMWNKIKKSEWVITDRLHAVIFSAITGTPCIAFDNTNGKVHGVCKTWLMQHPNIHIANTLDDIKKDMFMPQKNSASVSLEPYYHVFAKRIEDLVSKK